MTTSIKKSLLIACAACLALFVASCNDDDASSKQPRVGAFFIAVTGETTQYILQADDLESGNLLISDNVRELEQTGYTWIFNDDPSVAVGLIYQQGDPGIGLGFAIDGEKNLLDPAQFIITSRFTSYGFFDKYALTCVGGQTPASDSSRSDYVTFNFINLENNFSLTDRSIPTLNITGNGGQATFSGIADMGNGEFLTGLVVSAPKDPSAGGGSSSGTIAYPDSVWVAAFDANLNLKRIYRDNRISYSSGRFRSQYYSQIGRATDGSVYVFSGSYESATTKPCGALRINKNATAFDANYYFNIEEKTGGYHFRKVWHVDGDYFMLELYNDLTPTATGAATRYGIVNMSAKTFSWITGIPAYDQITGTGLPAPYNGKIYFPIVIEGEYPTIYAIDPVTSTATKGLSVTGATSINAVGRLTR
ncbi:MAG: DUF4374 domain-containing protein [Odoribacteraceae bacterium]|jgi:hypothetical protein|nr:DUF4374 domain-containing protein [Odoribacteraceae bacterium]